MARVANPYSENESSDNEDQDYTVVGSREEGGGSAASEADTLVPGAVQHVQQTGYPSTRGVKQNTVVKKSVDVNEKPPQKREGNCCLIILNPPRPNY